MADQRKVIQGKKHLTHGLRRQVGDTCVFRSIAWLLAQSLSRSAQELADELMASAKEQPSFGYVAELARRLYPSADQIIVEDFTNRPGIEKRDQLVRLWPDHFVSMSLWMGKDRSGRDRWHVLPLLDVTSDGTIALLRDVDIAGEPDELTLALDEVARRHDFEPGGKDIAYIRKF